MLPCLLSASASNLKRRSRSSMANVYVHQCVRKGSDRRLVSPSPVPHCQRIFLICRTLADKIMRCLRSTKKEAAHMREAQHAQLNRRYCSFPVTELKLFVLLRAKMKSSP